MPMLPLLGLLLMQTPPPPPPARPPVAIGQPSVQTGGGRDQAQRLPVVGKSSLSGTVVSETGQPIKGARVSMSGGAVGRSVTTDASGSFTFEKLPEGRYSLSASRQRYLPGSYGQKRPERSGTSIQLADNQELKNLTITLFNAGVITGTVYGEDGEPVQNAQVRALRYSMRTGVRRLQSSNNASTDDRGVYRLFGLNPGDYVVSASSGQTDNNLTITAEMAVAMEKAAAAGGNISFTNGVLKLPDGSSIDAPSPVALAPTYYPGTTMPSGAVTITVRGGEERSGIDVSMQRVQTATVSGHVISRTGVAPQNVNISMQSVDEAGQGMPLPSARPDAEGRFTLRAVPPGQYVIVARATTTVRTEVPTGPASPTGAAAPVQSIQTVQTTSTGRTTVSVDGQPLTGVVVALDGGRSVSGRVLFEGGAQPDLTRVRMTASLQMIQTPGVQGMGSPQPAQIGPDGSFKIVGVPPGRYTLRVSGVQPWSTKTSMVNGRDSLDFPFDIDDEDVNNATVTMVAQQTPAELNGLISDQAGQPVADFTIVVFSADQRFWTPGSRRILTVRPGTDGRYTLRGIPPGDYQIAALSDLEPGMQYDQELLKSMFVASTRVTIADGAKVTQDLRVTVGGRP
jgi:protocatechuate 3,4-dioxygenase beta subunit